MKKAILPILFATLWISISEFLRNQFLLQTDWVNHYKSLNLVFPSAPVNGAVWGLWSCLYAIVIYLISQKFSLVETAILAWLLGFVMMWTVLWNLNVLPLSILPTAIPLSMVEAYIASFLVQWKRKSTT